MPRPSPPVGGARLGSPRSCVSIDPFASLTALGGFLSGLFIPAMAFGAVGLLGLTMFAPSRQQPWRAAIAGTAAAVTVLFIVWRVSGAIAAAAAGQGGAALYVFSAVDVIGLLDFLVFVGLLSRFRDRRAEADRRARAVAAADPATLPDVDVWIATYNEDWDVLEKTLIGALDLDWPGERLHIHVLDDGRRAWLAEACAEMGVHYVTRANNLHRKAGNHNNALARTSSPFILSLDADFIPAAQAIRRMIGFFDEQNVAIVQSPQVFHNPEPFRNNLLLHNALSDDLDLFYKIMQPARDAWDAAFYCGTSAMLRRAALEQVGGFATQGDIEDQITSMKLWQHGWRTIFLDEQLSTGLAPESVTTLHDQRNRWCRGSLQILFTRHGPFAPGFTMVQRLLFSQSYWVLGAFMPLWYSILPALVWLFGPQLFSHAPPDEIVAMPMLLMASIWLALLSLGERRWIPVVSPAFQLFMAVELLPTTLTSLIKPFGESLVRILPVTAKGEDAIRRRVDWPTCAVLSAIVLGTLVAIAYAALTPRPGRMGPDEALAALAWTLLDLATLGVALLTCFELPYRRRNQRFAIREAVELTVGGTTFFGRTENLSLSGALIAFDAPVDLAPGAAVSLALAGAALPRARVARILIAGGLVAVAFGDLAADARRALTRRVYLGPEPKPEPVIVNGAAIFRGVVRRYARMDI